MPQVKFIDHEGTEHAVDVDSGVNLMQAAIDNAVPSILGDCGGFCACATCHVWVDPDWKEKAGERSETEDDLLDGIEGADENSRLCCQIIASDELDGIVVRLPESQL